MSFSPAFLNRISQQFPLESDEFISALDNESSTSIRVNPYKSNRRETENIPWTKHGYYLPSRPSFTLDPLFHAGTYYVQESSSMFLEQVFEQHIDGNSTLRVLDLCAAPGGKSTHILSLLNKESYLISNEVIASRSQVLSENIIKWGMGNVVVTNNDPTHFKKLKSFFDVIVIDAPCSGEGMFRKDLESRNEWSESNAQLCSSRQKRIVHDIWDSLKEGGILIYSTCTFNPEENEINLHQLKEELNFDALPIKIEENWNIRTVQYKEILGYQFLPHLSRGEGFFLSALKKNGGEEGVKTKTVKAETEGRQFLKPEFRENYGCKTINDSLFLLPQNVLNDFDKIKSSLYLKHAGICLGEMAKGKLIPNHSLAMSTDLDLDAFPKIDLSREDALQFLARRDFNIDGALGWNLITHQSVPLGFIKNMGNRFNNYYPMEWRIRMNF